MIQLQRDSAKLDVFLCHILAESFYIGETTVTGKSYRDALEP